jgi:hypothetical protein
MTSVITVGGERLGLPLTVQAPVNIGRRVREGRRFNRVRGDTLPEDTRYRDDGCAVNPTCLTCPLPRCRYDDDRTLRAILNEPRDLAIVEAKENGVSIAEISSRFGVSKRTIFRILENADDLKRRRAEAPVPLYLRRPEPTKETRCA